MEPIDAYVSRNGELDAAICPKAQTTRRLNRLADLSSASDQPIIVEENGSAVVVVSKKALLRGIQGQWDQQ